MVAKRKLSLTHLSMASFLWDIGKQYSLRCDAAEPEDRRTRRHIWGYFVFLKKFRQKNEIKIQNHS